MGYEMSKPDLRAELEANLKLVCEGRKDKFSVLQEYVQKYKQVFIEAVTKAKKLDEALSQYLGERTEFTESEEFLMEISEPVRKCPQCGRDMVLKPKKDGGFYLSCTGYPSCRSAVWFPDSVLGVNRDGSVCPTCKPHPVHRLKFKFKRGSVPPLVPLEFVGCIGGCDEMLREILDLRYLHGTSHSNSQTANQLSQNRTENQLRDRVNSRNNNPYLPVPTVSMSRVSRTVQSVMASDDNVVVCNCGQNALLLTVRKDGPNQGRKFYKCSVGTCDFFLWADQDVEESGSRGGTVSRRNVTPDAGYLRRAESRGTSGKGEAVCMCNQPAVTRTVQKDGPNKGRAFHTCSKPREQQCGFFEWADENALRGSTNNRQDGNSFQNGPTAKKPRTCGLCHQPGHTRIKCPQNR